MRRLIIALCLAAGCATSTKATVLEKAYDDPGRRRELFEANLLALDRNPGYVSEFFGMALRHKTTLDRFVENQTRELETNDELAALNAEHLRAHPRALERTMVKTLDAVARDPAARRAIADAMKARATLAAGIILEAQDALAALAKAMAGLAAKDRSKLNDLKEAFREAMR